MPSLNKDVLQKFLHKIYKGYYRSVEYHNDMHAADVLQMSYLILTNGGVIEWAELNQLDQLAVFISAVCHDYGHDGFTNAYHVNSISERAVRYSDQSVQENFHVAESFAILQNEEFNFLQEFS